MKKFIFSYIINIFLILIFIILLWTIFSPNLRSKIFSLSSGILNNYYSKHRLSDDENNKINEIFDELEDEEDNKTIH